MPQITDPEEIRTLLETDRSWSAYALGDLEPNQFQHCIWYHPQNGGDAIVLVYKGLDPPVLFILGDEKAVAPLFDELSSESRFQLAIRPEMLAPVRARYEIDAEQSMWRMVLNAPEQIAEPSAKAVRLSPEHLPKLLTLHANGDETGETPDAFVPSMLEGGIYFGVFDQTDNLVCSAGTHVVSPLEGVAALGNIYTHTQHRGQGLATIATSAVVYELLRLQISTIVLNVKTNNLSAISIYNKIGFRRYCLFYEGRARRRC